MKVFLDTNVLVDFLLDRFKTQSGISKAIKRIGYSNLYVCALTVHIVFYVLKIKYGSEMYERVSRIINAINVLPLHGVHIEASLDIPYGDYEDTLQFLSCEGLCDYIVTKDTKDFATIKKILKSKIKIVNDLTEIP